MSGERPQPGRWAQRLVLCGGLACMLWATTARPGGAGSGVPVALAVASVGWLAWVLVGPHGDTPALRALTAVTALSGSVLLLLHPSLAVFWFVFWPCVSGAANFSGRFSAAVTAGSAAVLVAGYLDHRGTALAGFAALAFVGHVVGRNRRMYIGLAREATHSADEREKAATLGERGRIARELHDVLGHSLTGISLQVESAAAARESGADPEQALAHLECAGLLVRSGQREAVAAVRTLREGEVALRVMLAELVDSHRKSGAPAGFTVTGTPRPVDAVPALALYRVAQEALTNAARHAPGEAADVRLAFTADETTVSVVNALGAGAPDAISGGHGLVGMEERMAEVGGTVTAGRSGAGWSVEARVSA